MFSILLTMVVSLTSFFVIISEADINTFKGKNRENKSFTDISSCIPYGINTSLFENGGYCKRIIGNVAVNGTPELEDNEEKLRHYETNIQSLFGFVNPPQSCTGKIDDIYCHHYFKRCFIDSPVQTVCKEACETFRSVCKKLLGFSLFLPALKIDVHVIDCTVLPSRDESSICYDPDTIREQNVWESKDCYYGSGRGYRGSISTTILGHTCQPWIAVYPHLHQAVRQQMSEVIKHSGNFCRNPGGLSIKGPWCYYYITNTTLHWKYCDVPKCSPKAPSSPPANFRGHNLSSRSIKLSWVKGPKFLPYDIIGFHLACIRLHSTEAYTTNLSPVQLKWVFKGLRKFTNYSCRLRAYNRFGNGTWSKELVISTDEDVPDRPPSEISAFRLDKNSVQLNWRPVSPEHTNGMVLGYRVFYNEVHNTSRAASIKLAAGETHLTIGGLRPNTNYSFQILAFTSKGNGPISTKYFAKTFSDFSMKRNRESDDRRQSSTTGLGTETIVITIVISSIVAVGVICLAIYFVRKKQSRNLRVRYMTPNVPGTDINESVVAVEAIDVGEVREFTPPREIKTCSEDGGTAQRD